MPGAPNRPPSAGPVPVAAVPPDEAARRVLRRLAPSRIALRLDVWRGGVAPELFTPFDRAETAYAAGDWNGAAGHLDQLAIRFAEPRWPTLPAPFKELRVAIPAPMPPSWDPEFRLEAPEKEVRKLKRQTETQLLLAAASLGWMEQHSLAADDLRPLLDGAKATFDAQGPVPAVYDALDAMWAEVRARVPVPQSGRPAVAPPPAPTAHDAT